MKTIAFKRLANIVRQRHCEILHDNSKKQETEKLIKDTLLDASERAIIVDIIDDTRQDTSSVCHPTDDGDQEKRVAENDPTPEISTMERVPCEKFQGTIVANTSSQIRPRDFELCSSTLSQPMRLPEGLSVMPGNIHSSLSSASISVDGDDVLAGAIYCGSVVTRSEDDTADSDSDLEMVPYGILDALRHLVGFEGNELSRDSFSVGSDEFISWTSDDSESYHDDEETEDVKMSSSSSYSSFDSTTRSVLKRPRSVATGVADAEDQKVRPNQDDQDDRDDQTVTAEWKSENLASTRADVLASRMTRSDSTTTSRDCREGKKSQKLNIANEDRWVPIFFKRVRSDDEASSAGVEIPITEFTKLNKGTPQYCQQETAISDDNITSIVGNGSAAHAGRPKTLKEAHKPGHALDSKQATSSRGRAVMSPKSPNPRTLARKLSTGKVSAVTSQARLPIVLKMPQDRGDALDSDEVTSEGMEVPFTKLCQAAVPKVLKTTKKPGHGFNSDEVTSDGMEVPLANFPHAEIPKVLKATKKPGHTFDSDDVTSEGMEVPLAKFPHAGIPKVHKITEKREHGFDSDEVTSEGMEVPLAKLPDAEIPKVLKITQKRGHGFDSDELTSEGMEVPLAKLPHMGIPKVLKIAQKPGYKLDSDEVTSEGMEVSLAKLPHARIPKGIKVPRCDSEEVTREGWEVPCAKLYPVSHSSARKSTTPLEFEEVSSAGVEIDSGPFPGVGGPIDNQAPEKRANVKHSVAKESTEAEEKAPPLSQTCFSKEVDFFCGWIHPGSTCVHCKKAFSWMDSRTECHVGHLHSGVKGEVHTTCIAEYEQLRKKYNKVLRQVALFGLLRRKRAKELKVRKIRRKQEGAGTSRRNSGFWRHLTRDTKGKEQQRRSRITNKNQRPRLPRPRSTRIATIPEDAPMRSPRRASSVVNTHKATSQRARMSALPNKGTSSNGGVSTSSKTQGHKQKEVILSTSQQSRPSPQGGTLPSTHRTRNSHRVVRDLDDVVVCPRGYTYGVFAK